MRSIHRFPIRVLAVLSLTALFVSAADDTLTKRRIAAPETLPEKTDERHERVAQDPVYEGKPLSSWLKFIRQRDEEMMPLAFDAIRGLGPDASAAVPELARVLTAPFSPIRVGRDSEEVIASKLSEIQIRSEAIDALVWIGEAAASATVLKGMQLIVAKEHLRGLTQSLVCGAD